MSLRCVCVKNGQLFSLILHFKHQSAKRVILLQKGGNASHVQMTRMESDALNPAFALKFRGIYEKKLLIDDNSIRVSP